MVVDVDGMMRFRVELGRALACVLAGLARIALFVSLSSDRSRTDALGFPTLEGAWGTSGRELRLPAGGPLADMAAGRNRAGSSKANQSKEDGCRLNKGPRMSYLSRNLVDPAAIMVVRGTVRARSKVTAWWHPIT